MKIGDTVSVVLPWKLGYRPCEKEGTIVALYANGICKVKVSLNHGGYKTVTGYVKDCKPVLHDIGK